MAVDAAELHSHLVRARVLGHVAQSLARRPVQELRRLVRQPEIGGRLDGRRDAALLERPDEILERVGETGLAKARRVDLDQKGAQLPNRRTAGLLGACERTGGVASGRDLLARGGQAVCGGDELLNRPVVEVGRDPSALELGGLDRPLERGLALAVRAADSPRERAREWKLDQLEHEQRADQRRDELPPQVAPARRNVAEAKVRLEEHRLAARRSERHVNLEQLPGSSLEAVLGPREVADSRVDAARLQDLEVVGAEAVGRAHEFRLVRVEDRAGRAPHLDAREVTAEHALADDPVEPRPCRRVAAKEPVAQLWLDDVAADDPSQRLRVLDRLLATDPRERHNADRAEDEQGEDAAGGELRHRNAD